MFYIHLYPIYWLSLVYNVHVPSRKKNKVFLRLKLYFLKNLQYILLNCPNIAWILLYLNNPLELDDLPGIRSPQFEKCQENMCEPTPLERAGILLR
jgi:hypothetical protein